MIRRATLDIDDNHSVWAATAAPSDPLPALNGEQTADVVIIGGGFTGVSTAWHLIQRFPDLRIVLLEAKRIGNGASGRNGGMALHWLHGPELDDRELCQRVWKVTDEAIDDIESLIRHYHLPVRWSRTGTLETSTNAQRAEAAHKDAETLASWGLPVRWLQGAELKAHIDATGTVGGMFDPRAGQLHGLDLLLAMKGLLTERGVRICENSPVVQIEEGRTHRVHTHGGLVRAANLVLATNGYTPRLGYFRSGIFPLHSHVLATEARPPDWWRERGWGDVAGFTDDYDRISYASRSPDGWALFGGGSNASYAYQFNNATAFRGSTAAGQGVVESTFRRYFPRADVPVAHRWTGTLGITMDRMCGMGVMGEHKNIYYAVGYSGHGVVLANLAGRVLTDLYADHHEPWKDLPFYQRQPGGIPPEPFRWVGYKLYTAATGRSPRRR